MSRWTVNNNGTQSFKPIFSYPLAPKPLVPLLNCDWLISTYDFNLYKG